MPEGKCPSCGLLIPAVEVIEIAKQWQPLENLPLAFLCPHCKVILGVSLDPEELERKIRRLIEEQLQAIGAS